MIKLCAFADEYGSSLEEQIEGLKANQISLVELRSIDKINIASITLEQAKYIKQTLDDNGIAVWSLGSPIGKVDIATSFDEHLAKLRHLCELAKIFNTTRIRMFSFFNAYNEGEKVFASLQKMVYVAKEYGVDLHHENEKEIYGDTIARVKEIIENVQGLKYVYDPANFIQCEQNGKEALKALFDKMSYFHIKDVIAKTGEIVPAGKGDGAIRDLVTMIGDKDMTLTLEPHLALFDTYASIDQTELKHKFVFKSKKEAFNSAVDAIKNVLYSAGFVNQDGCYIRDTRVVRYGVIGLGNIGTLHLDNFFANNSIPNSVVTAIADVNPTKIENTLKRFPQGKFEIYTNGSDLIERGNVDAVIVAVPHYQHPTLSIQALKKGLHVVCEKPAGVYTKQVKEMNEIAQKSKGLFTMMFNQRTNCIYRKMKEMVDQGLIGDIKRINWIITDWYRAQSYYDSGDWRATWSGEGGGVLLNQCPHQIDLLQWITGLMPTKIHSFVHFGKWHDIEVDDDVTAYLEYPNGATGVFITSTGDAPGTNRFEILGTKGKLVAENSNLVFYQNEIDEREFCKTYKGGFGAPKAQKIDVQTDGENLQHVGILRNFTNAILNKEPLFVDGKEGLKGVILMNGILLSGWLGQTVNLPFDDEVYLYELEKRIKNSRRKDVATDVIFEMESSFNRK